MNTENICRECVSKINKAVLPEREAKDLVEEIGDFFDIVKSGVAWTMAQPVIAAMIVMCQRERAEITVVSQIRELGRIMAKAHPGHHLDEIARWNPDDPKFTAYWTILYAERNRNISDPARRLLSRFRRGEGQREEYFGHESEEVKELLSHPYHSEFQTFMIDEMAKFFGGKIPADGAKIEEGTDKELPEFRSFNPLQLLDLKDGIHMGDVIGSFTSTAKLQTIGGHIFFNVKNVMSLASFYGENLLGHGLVTNPVTGPLSNKTHFFSWHVPIPKQYR